MDIKVGRKAIADELRAEGEHALAPTHLVSPERQAFARQKTGRREPRRLRRGARLFPLWLFGFAARAPAAKFRLPAPSAGRDSA